MGTLQQVATTDGIGLLRLDRPERRNALDSCLLGELADALERLTADEDLRVLVFSTTNSRALCSGVDINEPLDHAGGVARMKSFSRFLTSLEAFPVPTIAVCVGNCVGGGDAEGFELAERDLVRNASHDDGAAFPERDAFTPERESDLSPAEYGEADEEESQDR